jgi:transcriptional regulator with XRE-family HTH domain
MTPIIPAAVCVPPINEPLARAIGEARAVGVPGYAIAEYAGISPALLSMIVRGRARATDATARSIARALDRDPSDLFPDVARRGGRRRRP